MDVNTYKTDPAFIRSELENGQQQAFIANIDRNLRIVAKPQLEDGAVSILVTAEFLDNENVWTVDEPAVFSLIGFIESNTIG